MKRILVITMGLILTAAIVGGSMALLHLYLGAIHPRMTESLKSMITGKVSAEYAKSHHAKWYSEITEAEEVETPGGGEE